MTKKISKLLSKWVPVLLWAWLIFALSSLPQQHASSVYTVDFAVKKLAHITEYAILYTLLFRALDQKFTAAFLLTILYAATDELHQSYVPSRTPRIYDILGFDLAGAAIAAYTTWKLKLIRRNKH